MQLTPVFLAYSSNVINSLINQSSNELFFDFSENLLLFEMTLNILLQVFQRSSESTYDRKIETHITMSS